MSQSEQAQASAVVVACQPLDALDGDIRCGVKARIASQLQIFGARCPGLEPIRPVADDQCRFRPFATMNRDHVLGDTVGRDEINWQFHVGMLQANDEGRGVWRAHAQRRGWFAPEADIYRANDGIEARGLCGARLRLQVPSQGVDEVTGRERLAVGPTEITPQSKSPGQPIGTRRPGFRTTRHHFACGIGNGETGEEFRRHLRGDLTGGTLWVERGQLTRYDAAQYGRRLCGRRSDRAQRSRRSGDEKVPALHGPQCSMSQW